MIDLPTVRALIERARADTADGLTAREQLVTVADRLCHDAGKAQARGDHWKGVAIEMEQDRDRLLAELNRIRALRPAATISPAVHTPGRVLAYLHRLGWVREGGGRVAELWHLVGEPDKRVMVPLIPRAPDYAKVLRFLVSDLARVQGAGEDSVLAGIEAEDA